MVLDDFSIFYYYYFESINLIKYIFFKYITVVSFKIAKFQTKSFKFSLFVSFVLHTYTYML